MTTDGTNIFTPKPPIMTIESLIDFGFKEYSVSAHSSHNRNWQYCLRTPVGKKLYVQVRLWCFSQYSSPERGEVQDSFDADCQFDMNGPKTFNVNCSVNDMTPAQVVEWFNNLHDKMGCTYYEMCNEHIDEENKIHNCTQCGNWLPPEEAVDPFLCQPCKYEKETGFKKPLKTKGKQ